jgi:antitoxin VapB
LEASNITQSTVFTNNRTQAVRLPADTRFFDSVKNVAARVVGGERIINPANAAWDSFFTATTLATDDFLVEREETKKYSE